jgi:energy-coupling factor transport system substrate-specific component
MVKRASVDGLLLVVMSLVGAAAFFYPFILPGLVVSGASDDGGSAAAAPLLLTIVMACALVAAISLGRGTSGAGLDASRTVALLAALAAIDALLRLIPSVGGASLIFAPILLAGAVFGAEFGLLLGVLSLALSAFITGGIGPWLPYQMMAAGWVGATAGLIVWPTSPVRRIAALAAFGALWGFAYGALMNLYSWPYLTPGGLDAGISWNPGAGLAGNIDRYLRYYFVTSLAHDAMRAAANGLLIIAIGAPVLRLLERYRRQSIWSDLGVSPGTSAATPPAASRKT